MHKWLSVYFEGVNPKLKGSVMVPLLCPVHGDPVQQLAAKFQELPEFQEFVV